MTNLPRAVAIGLTLLALNACSRYADLPAGTVLEISGTTAIVEEKTVEIPKLAEEAPPSSDYLVGPGDVLYINIQGKPDLGSPNLAASGSGRVTGSRVDGKGDVHLPLIGSVPVTGLSVVQIQELLAERFAPYLNQPWVVVEIAEYRSKPLYLLGQFRTAGAFYMDRPYTLVQSLSLAGGLLDTANLRRARLIRNNRTQPVDFYAVLQEGDSSQNIWLQAGDTLFVPDDKNQNVFVFGAVKKAGPVPMPNGELNLAQALATVELNETRGEERLVRIIRSLSVTRGQLLVVDLAKTLNGEALPFPLLEGDIVYVPRNGVGNWNEALAEILPSLTTVSAVLQPFVQIKFLSN